MGVEHNLVGARRGIEGNLLAHRLARFDNFSVVVAHHHKRRGKDGKVLACTPRFSKARFQMRHDKFAQVLGRVERMSVQAVA